MTRSEMETTSLLGRCSGHLSHHSSQEFPLRLKTVPMCWIGLNCLIEWMLGLHFLTLNSNKILHHWKAEWQGHAAQHCFFPWCQALDLWLKFLKKSSKEPGPINQRWYLAETEKVGGLGSWGKDENCSGKIMNLTIIRFNFKLGLQLHNLLVGWSWANDNL